MALFAGPKSYNSIVAPLKKIEGELSTYIGDQKQAVQNLESDKKEIDGKIAVSNLEVKKSEHTAGKIAELLGIDFDGDGKPDFVEPEEIPPIQE
jgi:hypothetical protein